MRQGCWEVWNFQSLSSPPLAPRQFLPLRLLPPLTCLAAAVFAAGTRLTWAMLAASALRGVRAAASAATAPALVTIAIIFRMQLLILVIYTLSSLINGGISCGLQHWGGRFNPKTIVNLLKHLQIYTYEFPIEPRLVHIPIRINIEDETKTKSND
ncbi:hypothetical protein DTO271D3_5957 [Paecilomyces variotii]|nr:hypothetical protein DTO271D3_5957 [Paecilomyces variotii]